MNKYDSRRVRRIFTKGVFQLTPMGMILLPEECESFLYRGPVAEAVAVLFTPPYGVAGDISRPNAPYVAETQALNPAAAFSTFGLPGQMVGGLFVPITGTGQQPYGLLIRPYPAQGANAADPLGVAVPIATGPCSVLRKGYANVNLQLQTSAAAFGGTVYIRFQNPVAGQVVGGLESGTTANNYAWTAANAQFMGPADANGNVEISFGAANV